MINESSYTLEPTVDLALKGVKLALSPSPNAVTTNQIEISNYY